MVNKATGQYEKALTEAQKAIELDPDFAIGYYNLGVNHVYLDRLEEGEDALRRAAGRGLEIDGKVYTIPAALRVSVIPVAWSRQSPR